jgi:hypothetical protein
MKWSASGLTRLLALVAVVAAGPPARAQAPPPPGAILQAGASTGPAAQVTVRAWVNGRPIFDQELLNDAAFELLRASQLPEPERSAKRAEILKAHLESMINDELVWQDALHKLKQNPLAWDKLKELAAKDFDRSLPKRKKYFGGEENFQHWLSLQGLTLETYRKKFEQMFIRGQYILSRAQGKVDAIGQPDIWEYYQDHRNEFQTVDRVEWQDLFIAVGPKHPTLQDARHFAEQLVAQLRAGRDFDSLLPYDDGVGSTNKGLGIGQLRGQIRPPEVEPYLWAMKDGDVGAPLDLSTGVHVFRLVKRSYAGPLPYDEKVQAQIRNKLTHEVRERETKAMIRELKARAVIQVERHPLP